MTITGIALGDDDLFGALFPGYLCCGDDHPGVADRCHSARNGVIIQKKKPKMGRLYDVGFEQNSVTFLYGKPTGKFTGPAHHTFDLGHTFRRPAHLHQSQFFLRFCCVISPD